MDLRVRDRKTGIVRTITHKAYAALGPKVYEKLGPEEPAAKVAPLKVEEPIVEEETADEPESTPEEVTIPKKRPGRPARVKSISSDSTEDEK